MIITIKTLRTRNGFEQKDVEKALGLSQGTVSHWENDGVLPKIKYLQQLARLYNVTTDQLIDVIGVNNYKRVNEKKVIVIGKSQYTIVPDDYGYDKGYDGCTFYIRMLETGEEYVTNNLWCQGETNTPATAEFIHKEYMYI